MHISHGEGADRHIVVGKVEPAVQAYAGKQEAAAPDSFHPSSEDREEGDTDDSSGPGGIMYTSVLSLHSCIHSFIYSFIACRVHRSATFRHNGVVLFKNVLSSTLSSVNCDFILRCGVFSLLKQNCAFPPPWVLFIQN